MILPFDRIALLFPALVFVLGSCSVEVDDIAEPSGFESELASPVGEEELSGTAAEDPVWDEPRSARRCEISVDGSPLPPDACAAVPVGHWTFEDCRPETTVLLDSAELMHHATRSASLACADGQSGRALSFATDRDIVRVTDMPDYVLDSGVTIAAWAKPSAIDGVRTLVRKRDEGNSAFALVINEGSYRFTVRLASGRSASVSAPATEGRWTHVAATYDRTFLRLYIDGAEAARTRALGRIVRGKGPLLMGNDGAGRRFLGVLDEVWFNVMAAPAAAIQAMTCIHRAPVLTVDPLISPAVQAGSVVTYNVTLMNQNSASCAPENYQTAIGLSGGTLTSVPRTMFLTTLATGESSTIPVAVTSPVDALPRSYPVVFRTIPLLPANTAAGWAQVNAQYVVAASP